MGSSTKIYLPLHVQSERVNKVLAKLAGSVFEYDAFPETTLVRSVSGRGFDTVKTPVPFDPNLPASKENPWHMELSKESSERFGISPSAPSGLEYGQMSFTDAAGQAHGWMFFQESEDEIHKTLLPGSHGFAVELGKGLARFFGGKVIFNDEASLDDEYDFIVSNRRAKFPARIKGQSSDDRWYQFENLLATEPMINSVDLKNSLAKYGGNQAHQNLLNHLQVMEKKRALIDIATQARPSAKATSRKPRL